MSPSTLTLSLLVMVVACTALLYMPGALGNSDSIGKCYPDRSNCSQCYQTLVESLLSSSDNLYRLSRAFFPPRDNPPEFVKVRYYFGDMKSDDTKTSIWFWSLYTTNFLHSPYTFQFLSLFFGKPQLYYTGELNISLAKECTDVSIEMMEFLTQRLKLYAQKQSTTPEIDDTYSAKGGNGKTWEDRLKDDKGIAKIIICSQIFISLFALIIISLMGALRVMPKFINNERNNDENNTNSCCAVTVMEKYSKLLTSDDTIPLTFSAFVLSIIIHLYIVILDFITLSYREVINKNDEDLTAIYDSGNTSSYSILYNLPIVVLVFDMLATLPLLVIIILSLIVVCYKVPSGPTLYTVTKGFYAFLISTGIICTIFVILMHFPYIAIAFLNDAYHAGSMFIYYSILCFALFVIVEVVYKTIIIKMSCTRCQYGILIGVLFVVILIFLGLIATVTCYFVLIPINMSISDAPNRLIGLYQSGVVLIAAIIVYKTFLRKSRKPIQKAIKTSKKFGEKDDWTKLTAEEKQDRFYAKVLAMVNEYKVAESEEEGQQSQADENEGHTGREAIVADRENADTQPSEVNEENANTTQPIVTALIIENTDTQLTEADGVSTGTQST